MGDNFSRNRPLYRTLMLYRVPKLSVFFIRQIAFECTCFIQRHLSSVRILSVPIPSTLFCLPLSVVSATDESVPNNGEK